MVVALHLGMMIGKPENTVWEGVLVRHFRLCVIQQNLIFLEINWDNSSWVYGDKNRYFKLKHNLFLTLTKWCA